MITPDTIQVLKDHISSAQSILIIFSSDAKFDQVASAMTLYLGLEQLGKQVTVFSPSLVTVEHSSLVGIDKVATQIGNKNLQVSFEYEADRVDKVSYHIDEESKKFHLIIQPKKGQRPLSSEGVEFSYTGAEADVILLVGVRSLDDLDQLYVGYEDLYNSATTISLNTYETPFGSVKVNISGSASYSESTAYVLQELGAELTSDMATNLLMGIEEATDSFHSLSTSADTFEIVSQLLRAGARRKTRTKPSASINGFAEAFSKVGKSGPPVRPQQLPKFDQSTEEMASNMKKKQKVIVPSEMPRMEGGSRL
jgi:hypothetical protein